MVCIIDDREDVWDFAPNLITVKPYRFFKGTGDINDPFVNKGSPAALSTKDEADESREDKTLNSDESPSCQSRTKDCASTSEKKNNCVYVEEGNTMLSDGDYKSDKNERENSVDEKKDVADSVESEIQERTKEEGQTNGRYQICRTSFCQV